MSIITRVALRKSFGVCNPMNPACSQIYNSALKSTGSAQQQMDEFWAKNKETNRPMSPHLTIYKPQLTSMLSITHRATGMMLAGATCAFAAATVIPGAAECALQTANYLHGSMLGSLVLFDIKMCLAWPLTFHICNGVRHLMWDNASGLSLNSVYTTGWAVLLSSLVLSALFTLLMQ
uniref:succinate dehydrogenase cytochrome b560 subunit, mitochondrial-like n=1 Tax=Ciona intestinalis TaxID=7719 RepID=UPI0002B8D6C5|nr:succinate dehydrogenase cytochrome b560 subunit, mitochondrial-like [Ciona intestinalis]|eukprot:XP_004226804.1 succinate dehydrogenase cytochrome b560 subunit, mitochondrial-like [Ciona intestinalis]